MKKIGFTIVIGIFSVFMLSGQASIEGTVSDKETGEPILFGDVTMYKEGVIVKAVSTDINGYYNANNITPGYYDIEFTYVGYGTNRQEKVLIKEGQTLRLDAILDPGLTLEEIVVTEYKVPLFDNSETSNTRTVTSENIKNIATRNVNTIAATAGGVATIDGGDLNIRGSRANATNYIVDGIRVSGNFIPDSEIEQLSIITGGLQAKYGDVTGGVVTIVTKGPANSFRGSLEAETSQYLDPFDRTLLRGSVSGPILKSKKDTTQSIVGYRFSGQYVDQKFPYTYKGDYVFPESTIKELQANPIGITPEGNPGDARAELFSDAVLTQEIPNERNQRLIGTGKIDVRFSDAIDMSFTGGYTRRDFNFSTGTDQDASTGNWRLLNYMNNPVGEDEDLRGNIRFRHKIGSNENQLDENGQPIESNSVIRNATYTITAGYEKAKRLRHDATHEDRFFRYGHVGTTDENYFPTFAHAFIQGPFGDTSFSIHTDWSDSLVSFTNGPHNPVYANYNQFFGDVFIDQNIDEQTFVARNGFITQATNAWAMFSNVGQVYDRYIKQDNERYTLLVDANFDIFPGGTKKGRHNIEFGFMYEQRVNRNYTLVPFNLWDVARNAVNVNFGSGLDTNNILRIDEVWNPIAQRFDTTEIYSPVYNTPDGENQFWRRFRNKFGIDERDYVFIDEYDPDDLDLSMFSPFELVNLNRVGMQGFDYLGNRVSSDASFDDFFAVEADGTRSFIAPPDRPIYTAAYIQDKFSFKDLYFTVGLRVDRFDANTKVLRDPYSLYEIQTADEFFATLDEDLPGNIDPNWKVYTTSQNGEVVNAYRDGDQWYSPEGNPVNDGRELIAGAVFAKQTNFNDNIQDADYDLNRTFTDYEPELNWMPRIAFSFPLSDQAGFFAHYDILYQRPPERNTISPQTYFFMPQRSFNQNNPLSNPNLQSEKTTDFEVGFQQKISTNSALRLSVYYREQNDLIQARLYDLTTNIGATDNYFGFANVDFGTTKGVAFRYDLRRSGNTEIYMTYNLQFADGTGSSTTSQIGNVGNGTNLTEVFPLSFDERHQLNFSFDYRYGSASRYTGPTIGGKAILANTGLNILTSAISGRPFTRQSRPARFGGAGIQGGFNESRYPWRFNMDLQLDKTFSLVDREGPNDVRVNAYVRVLNLLNTENIIGWYRASLSDTDDGFLSTTPGQAELQSQINQGKDLDIYYQARQWSLLNNNFYALPRRVFIGAAISF